LALLVAVAVLAGSHLSVVLQRPARSPEDPVQAVNLPLVQETSNDDIFLIVLDGYARNDILRDRLGFTNDKLVENLRSHGFFIPSAARSNYTSTFASLSSVFAMDYLLESGPAGDSEIAKARAYLRGAGPAVEFFTSQGYEFVYVESPWSVSVCGPDVDTCYAHWSFSETARWLTEFTILAPLVDAGSWDISADRAMDQFAVLTELAGADSESPRLIYAHIGIPHPPFVLDAECNRWANPSSLEWYPSDEDAGPYLDQILCTNHQLITLVEAIDRHNPEAVVMVTSDHGITLERQDLVDPSQWTADQIEQATAVFTAYRMPDGCPLANRPDFELVNLFRMTIDCMFDGTLESLPGRQFFANPLHRGPLEIVELTR
jgi:hypothetical protein